MEIVALTKKDYPKWDAFCLECDDAWFWHTTEFLEYILNVRPKLKAQSKSFMLLNDNKIIAICPLVIEEKNGVREFSYDGSFGQVPVFVKLTAKLKGKAEKAVFDEIDNLAKKNNVLRASFKFSPLAPAFLNSKKQTSNALMKFGYLDASWHTQIIDLSKSIEELRKDVRHGHDYDIDRASKVLKAVVFDKNASREDFDGFKEMHHKAAGKVTRPEITFDMMYSWMKKGFAFLIGAKKDEKDGEFVGYGYFTIYKNNVYYSSAANSPKHEKEIPTAHFVVWKAIELAKKKNANFFDLGYQYFSPILHYFPSEKELHISLFKRGFGGFTVPLFAGEKFYDKNYFLKVYKERIDKYSETIK